MSAYIVDTDTIDYIVGIMKTSRGGSFYAHGTYAEFDELVAAGILDRRFDRISFVEDELVGKILYHQNIRSVQARYPDSIALPGPIDAPRTYTRRFVHGEISPVVALKSLFCLRYQSCETEDYPQTLAFALSEWLERLCIDALPGYDDAPWGWTRPTVGVNSY